MSNEANTQDHVFTNDVFDKDDGNGECVYTNHKDITKYKIPVTELQNVITEKHKDNGFIKEYEVSSVYMRPTIL